MGVGGSGLRNRRTKDFVLGRLLLGSPLDDLLGLDQFVDQPGHDLSSAAFRAEDRVFLVDLFSAGVPMN
jgi:hypothetical protein